MPARAPQGSPLKPESAEGPEAPEALFISSLLGEGAFTPERYGITGEHLECYKPLFRFCCDHQDRTGRAPALDLVACSFPDFRYTKGIDVSWAAGQLRRAAASRAMRVTLGDAIAMVNDDDVEAAYSAIAALPPPMGTRRPGIEGFDASYIDDVVSTTRIPVPWDSLGRVTGGIGWNELWYVGARTGMGKTNIGCVYAAAAVQKGFTAAYWSLEMPAHVINAKIRKVLASRDQKLVRALESEDRETVKRALDELATRTPGSFRTFDPSHGACTVEAVRDSQADADIVFIDHVGLMTTLDGRRAIDDWRVAALISNRLKEETLRQGPPILGLLQVNRQGETASGLRTPKVSELADTDAFGRDADVVVTMVRYSDTVMTHEAPKVRNGPTARWWTYYQPKTGVFTEVTRQLADEIAARDEDRRSGF